MTDEELVKRLREGATWDDDVAAADRIEALSADLARSTRMIAKMVPLSACGNYVFWDGVGDIELDHNGELRRTIEALTAKVKLMDDLDVINGEKIEALTAERDEARAGNHSGNEHEPTWRELTDYWKQRDEAAEAKLAECLERNALLEARLGKAVEALELAHAALSGANMNMRVVERKVRAAIAEIKSSKAAPPYGLEGGKV